MGGVYTIIFMLTMADGEVKFLSSPTEFLTEAACEEYRPSALSIMLEAHALEDVMGITDPSTIADLVVMCSGTSQYEA